MIRPMTKVQIALPRADEERFLAWLQDKEVFHIQSLAPTKKTVFEHGESLDLLLAQTQFALEFIDRIRTEVGQEKKRDFANIFAPKPTATLEGLENTLQRLDLVGLIERIRTTNDELMQLKSDEAVTQEALMVAKPWEAITVTGVTLYGFAAVQHVLLTVNLKEELLVKKLLQDIPTLALLEIKRDVEKKRGIIYLQVVVHKQEARFVDDILAQTNATRIELPLRAHESLSDYVLRLEDTLTELAARHKILLQEARAFIARERDFKLAYDGLLHRKERQAAAASSERLSRSVLYEGWIPTDQYDAMTSEIGALFPGIVLENVTAEENEVPPVALANSSLFEPFEAVTNIYGWPKYREIDPTVPLSLFFLIAFGLALTDAGYGIVMMLATWAAQRFFKLKRDMKKMVRLLFYAGFSTLIFGALTGGWFSVDLAALPKGLIRDALLAVKVIDPISAPITLLLVAFAIGIVQLLFAWMVRGYDHYRQGNLVALVFDDAAWVSMVVTILLWAGSAQGILPAYLVTPFGYAVLANALVLVLSQGRAYANPLLKIGSGVLSLYGLVGFLSDMLSYSRLLALGLATGIIGLVVNLMGAMAVESVPYVGWLLAVPILIGGHIFNLGINALGAFIHSGRLQFVEFFPKFMEGGGAAYRPFGRASKYVDNPKDFE